MNGFEINVTVKSAIYGSPTVTCGHAQKDRLSFVMITCLKLFIMRVTEPLGKGNSKGIREQAGRIAKQHPNLPRHPAVAYLYLVRW
jgi:hypothetical protein